MAQISVLNSDSGPSSGTSVAGVERRDAVDARELSVGTEDFREIRDEADGRADRVDTLPGIMSR